MPRQNTITNSTFPNSSPRIIRSEIIHSTLANLDASDTISRCYIDASTITKTTKPANALDGVPVTSPDPTPTPTPEPTPTKSITLKRSKITTSTLTNTSLSRSTITASSLTNIPRARSAVAASSTLDNVSRLRRVNLTNSTITERSSMARSQAKDSVVSGSSVSRGSLEKSRVLRSRLRRSNIRDCEVSDCVIINTNFRGKVLRNGVWRNGRLVGSCAKGEGEGVVVDGQVSFLFLSLGDLEDLFADGEQKLDTPMKGEKGTAKWIEGLESEMESSDALDSESESESESDDDDAMPKKEQKKKEQVREDPPPPYTP
ncbi:hypothetical protein BDW74DRAFT_73260 [Aspergillus multicolor]|uniref:uncharacterized protein n=1 Tax=Aspergillus multicolor TaxID=41759 RepID=UPI003CCD9752